MVVLAIALVGVVVTASAFVLHKTRKAPDASPPLNIAIVGDVYAAGSNNRVVWPTLLAQRTGWSVANFALPGAGFAADGQGDQSIGFQVDRARGANPRIIVMAAGVGDLAYAGSGFIGQAAVEAINKAKLSGIRTLAIGPTWYETPVPPEVTGVADEIHKAADDAGVPFLNALDPPWLAPDLMQADETAPTDAGQSVIADKVAAWLRSEVGRE